MKNRLLVCASGAVSDRGVDDVINTKNPDAELILLRDFHDKWVAFHQIPRDDLHRKKQEKAAAEMYQAHNAIIALRNPSPVIRLAMKRRANGGTV